MSALVVLLLTVTSSTSAAVGVTFTVDSTGDGADANVGDGVCADPTGACTLRAAIEESNASAGPKDTIAFGLTTPPFSIEPTTALPAITDPVEIDGTTQPGFMDKPIVELRGPSGLILNGLRLLTGDSTVRGLVVNRFNTQISIEASAGSGNRISGNFLGTDVTGMAAADPSYAGGSGISINGVGDVLIGGSGASDRNVISGSADGIDIFGGLDGVSRITIQGNYIGTDASGEAALAGIPVGAAVYGVLAQHTDTLIIGGDGPGEGNVISGNPGAGVILGSVSGDNTVGSGARIVGNLIGTDVDGETAVPNGSAGVHADVAISDLLIARNVISGNGGWSLELHDTERTAIQGNQIGVGVDGLTPIPNGSGVFLERAVDALIGGRRTDAAERNIISGNQGIGVLITADNVPAGTYTRNRIEGNLIGIDAEGGALGNRLNGVICCAGTLGNVIGGVAEDRGNVIAYNGVNAGNGLYDHGVWIVHRGDCPGGPEAAILGNSIHSNGALGIDLQSCTQYGPTPNDLSPPCPSPPGPDCDTGANDLQNFPEIRDVTNVGGQTVAEVEFDNTPDEDFRLEFFRNASCNETASPPPSWASGFYGEGQSLVGTKEVHTDLTGHWSGDVTLPGETGATEVITATATHFTEPAPSLVGSTSEFSECLADLAITKSDDPDPVAVGEQLTYMLKVTNEGPAPANVVQVVDTLPAGVGDAAITPSQGSCSQSGRTITCDLGLIARDGTAEITIVLDPGTEPREITNTAKVSSELRDPDESDNSASETTQVVIGGTGTIVVEKETLPAGSSQNFAFTTSYGPGFSLSDGQANTSAPLAAGTYSVSETAASGWDASATCTDGSPPSNIALSAGETVTCTFTNTKRGSVMLRKTTDGVVDPSKNILFVLTGPGLPAGGISGSTFGDQDGVLEFGSGNLVPAQTYTVCESPVPAGFTSFWKLDGVIVTPYNPDASKSPPEDLGTRCYAFSVAPGQARAFDVDNSHPGGDPRTIGYWKNWNRCTGGNQAATAQKNGGAAAGFFLVEDLLPQLVGDLAVTTCQKAVRLLAKQDQAGKNKASDAAYELGAQLLAARFNLAAGAEVCTAIQQAVLDGQTLLDQVNFSGSGDYLGSKSKNPQRAQALSLASTIDRYNNGNLC